MKSKIEYYSVGSHCFRVSFATPELMRNFVPKNCIIKKLDKVYIGEQSVFIEVCETNKEQCEKLLQKELEDYEKPIEIKFHGFSGSREVCIRFFDATKDNKPDGETWVCLNEEDRVSTSNWFGGIVDHGTKGTSLEKAFTFNVDRVEFTQERVDAHPKSPLFGKEQWQLIKIYGSNSRR